MFQAINKDGNNPLARAVRRVAQFNSHIRHDPRFSPNSTSEANIDHLTQEPLGVFPEHDVVMLDSELEQEMHMSDVTESDRDSTPSHLEIFFQKDNVDALNSGDSDRQIPETTETDCSEIDCLSEKLSGLTVAEKADNLSKSQSELTVNKETNADIDDINGDFGGYSFIIPMQLSKIMLVQSSCARGKSAESNILKQRLSELNEASKEITSQKSGEKECDEPQFRLPIRRKNTTSESISSAVLDVPLDKDKLLQELTEELNTVESLFNFSGLNKENYSNKKVANSSSIGTRYSTFPDSTPTPSKEANAAGSESTNRFKCKF
jgi:hypothetical protein